MSKLITQNDLQDILNEALPTPRYGGVQTASWTANSSAANNVKLTDSIHLTAGTYVITVKYPGISATLSTAIQYGTGTLLDSFCTSAGAAYSSHSYVINIPSEMDIFVVTATSSSITYTYKERGGLRAIQISESSVSDNEADYIVEQGTSGIWTYRKWNSGIAECWGYYSKSIAAKSTDSDNYVTYPFTFTATPNITLGLYAGGADLYRGHITNASTNNTQARITLINMHTAAVSFGLWINLFGRWK